MSKGRVLHGHFVNNGLSRSHINLNILLPDVLVIRHNPRILTRSASLCAVPAFMMSGD